MCNKTIDYKKLVACRLSMSEGGFCLWVIGLSSDVISKPAPTYDDSCATPISEFFHPIQGDDRNAIHRVPKTRDS